MFAAVAEAVEVELGVHRGEDGAFVVPILAAGIAGRHVLSAQAFHGIARHEGVLIVHLFVSVAVAELHGVLGFPVHEGVFLEDALQGKLGCVVLKQSHQTISNHILRHLRQHAVDLPKGVGAIKEFSHDGVIGRFINQRWVVGEKFVHFVEAGDEVRQIERMAIFFKHHIALHTRHVIGPAVGRRSRHGKLFAVTILNNLVGGQGGVSALRIAGEEELFVFLQAQLFVQLTNGEQHIYRGLSFGLDVLIDMEPLPVPEADVVGFKHRIAINSQAEAEEIFCS